MTLIPITQLRPRETSSQRLPPWFKVEPKTGPDYLDLKQTVERLKLHTICEEARCPNRWECWNARTATFLILGDICTRRCHYCSVETGRPQAVDPDEPSRVADAVRALRLRHAVITSVNRDELADGGAAVFAETIRLTRKRNPGCTIEVLIPDFAGNAAALETVCRERPEVLNHNIETVPRLFPSVRPQGKYQRSLELLDRASAHRLDTASGLRTTSGFRTKSGLIVGMGETPDEIRSVLQDLRKVGCDVVTIGQYLQPTKAHLPVVRYYEPVEFARLKAEALTLGFVHVEASPLSRSSYHAAEHAPR
jgi:lipoic acid synthetase